MVKTSYYQTKKLLLKLLIFGVFLLYFNTVYCKKKQKKNCSVGQLPINFAKWIALHMVLHSISSYPLHI